MGDPQAAAPSAVYAPAVQAAPAPAAGTPAYAAPVAAAPKKRHGCIIAVVVVLLLLLCACGGVAAALASMGKPRDLGVRYTISDYHTATAKAGLVLVAMSADAGSSGASGGSSASGSSNGSKSGTKGGSKGGTESGSKSTAAAPDSGDNSNGSGFTSDVTYGGSQPIDVTFTAAEISALLNYSHMPGWPISEAQVVFTGSDGFAMSCLFEYGGVKYPVFAEGTIGASGDHVFGAASSAQVAGFTVPEEYLGPGSDFVLSIINERLARIGSLNIEQAEIVDGGVHLVGTGAETATPVGE